MPTERKATVQLTPCEFTERANGIETMSFLLFDERAKTYPVTFRKLDELTEECRRLVREEFKMDAACYVRLPRGERKPPGFDAATRTVQTIRFHKKAPEAAQADFLTAPYINPETGEDVQCEHSAI